MSCFPPFSYDFRGQPEFSCRSCPRTDEIFPHTQPVAYQTRTEKTTALAGSFRAGDIRMVAAQKSLSRQDQRTYPTEVYRLSRISRFNEFALQNTLPADAHLGYQKTFFLSR
jgi:predicted phosphohydrolase